MDPNKQIKYSHYQITDAVNFGGVLDPEQCKQLAQRILALYDGNSDGNIDSFEVGYMLSDCYRAMNKGFNPTPTDIASYSRILDRKGTGRVTLEDIEQLCLKFFGAKSDKQPSQY
ncbi:unnamed protein product [Paramecium primaurelia]|uniref:Chromosome undetermined scaffold_109, whole genome shotgun sequence n=6 Tax=Paramecium TaxID=5884 RepID=A0BI01_PARTE|nr:uncharacterized protein GSPATT00029204001 [Paramecium tetraurelia]XP_001428157.1 uncharacterized protein GSPATT00030988001 [Paramecium tetraurelia]CAD8096098.1 unnamed protein product [Paramecium primaurelia]CAD8195868.1 unnamed protein product [Paramecium octaurelia]CAD8200019.1 unnamed protein product [Paramecium pentaurelia]CAD8202432.1 unnamed protein product [Paramecium octaurelia]CAK58168.1 unnamed protein product [Paramecium tetraurelia]|eukprot:XP_001425566.1 hypothetical protein (macronuclear) [Paramecium tetraurelia strain d4-2]